MACPHPCWEMDPTGLRSGSMCLSTPLSPAHSHTPPRQGRGLVSTPEAWASRVASGATAAVNHPLPVTCHLTLNKHAEENTSAGGFLLNQKKGNGPLSGECAKPRLGCTRGRAGEGVREAAPRPAAFSAHGRPPGSQALPHPPETHGRGDGGGLTAGARPAPLPRLPHQIPNCHSNPNRHQIPDGASCAGPRSLGWAGTRPGGVTS